MTDYEAPLYLIQPLASSTIPSDQYVKQKEAYDRANRALRIVNVIENSFDFSKEVIIDYNYWNWIKNIIDAGGLK